MKPFFRLLEIVAKRLKVRCLERDVLFETDVRWFVVFGEETPARRVEQSVDLDPGGGFFGGHSGGGERWREISEVIR